MDLTLLHNVLKHNGKHHKVETVQHSDFFFLQALHTKFSQNAFPTVYLSWADEMNRQKILRYELESVLADLWTGSEETREKLGRLCEPIYVWDEHSWYQHTGTPFLL